MKHLVLLALWAVQARPCQAAPVAAPAPARPNIILILADDLGWADLGCYGNTFHETPSLDRLAREGMRFTHFHAGPVCSPTRCNIQSGQDQARFGITQHIPGHRRPYALLEDPEVPRQLPLEVETFAERLAAAGYTTGYFGKWHLGQQGYGPQDQGWQTALEVKGHTQPGGGKGGKKEGLRTTDHLTDLALEFIHTHRETPFLLQVSHIAVHIPLQSRKDLVAKYEAKAQARAANAKGKQLPEVNPAYAALLEELDQSVGRLVAGVDAAGLGENTLIFFVSDNGGLEHTQGGDRVTSNSPLRGEKGTLYEGGIRVPALARWPGRVPAGAVCTTPLVTMDLYPTWVELAGAAMPAGQPCDGVSLAAVLREPAAALARDTLYWHLPHYHHSTPAGAIRRGGWKLLEFFEHDRLELYNLDQDPGETTNLADAEPTRARDLQKALQSWRRQVGARMPVPNPAYDAARATEMAKGKGREE